MEIQCLYIYNQSVQNTQGIKLINYPRFYVPAWKRIKLTDFI